MKAIDISELEKEAEKRGVAIHVLITEMCEKEEKKILTKPKTQKIKV